MWMELLKTVAAGRALTRDQSRAAFEAIMGGQADPVQVAALLAALAVRGEHADELAGAAAVLRERMTRVRCAAPAAIDTCGTGGDGVSTYNISTTVAVIAAAAGATVAKHGSHTNSRVSGSADVIRALGVNLEAGVPVLEQALADIGLAFLYAPRLHPAMKHAVPIRKALGFRTIFNLLGPLCNPAGVRRQIIGCATPATARLVADTLAQLDQPTCERGWVLTGHGGLCDLTLSGPSTVFEVSNGTVRLFTVDAADLGLPRSGVDPLRVADAAASAAAVRAVLAGEPGPRRDIALLNTAAALVVAGVAADLPAGLARAAHAVDSGAATAKLAALVRLAA